jgi:hypothetical protein
MVSNERLHARIRSAPWWLLSVALLGFSSAAHGRLSIPNQASSGGLLELGVRHRSPLRAPKTTTVFPSLDDTLHLAYLSKLAYVFRHHIDEETPYCESFNSNNGLITNTTHPLYGVHCEWYHYEPFLGTQVLLVSNDAKRYLAVVYAGTDNLRTSLEDANMAMSKFGQGSNITDSLIPEDAAVWIHAGFDHAVFTHEVYPQVELRVQQFLSHSDSRRQYRVFTSGHSLGAANAMLTAVALSLRNENITVTSVNFGCPQTGDYAWREYVNEHLMTEGTGTNLSTSVITSKAPNLSLWRVVLGWDLVPRLPNLFYHVGHTIQIWSDNHKKYEKDAPKTVEAYFHHYGNSSMGYVGAPAGWSSMPYVWVPGALGSHFVSHYIEHLEDLHQNNQWVAQFKKAVPDGVDDDTWVDPPDDHVYDMNYDLYDDDEHDQNVEAE